MRKFFATFYKDFLILSRDRSALLVLFFMPALLVLVLSLVQNNILETLGAEGVRLLVVDQDRGSLGQRIQKGLRESSPIRLVQEISGHAVTEEQARGLVAEGDFQFSLVIPEGSTARLAERARILARQSFFGGSGDIGPAPPGPPLKIFFDPTVQGAFRATVTASLGQVLLAIEMEEKGKQIGRILNTLLAARDNGFLWGRSAPNEEDMGRFLSGEPLLPIVKEAASHPVNGPFLPNAVQQNVPAWALFGMFFIAVPISGALIRERRESTLLRLRTLPVSLATILLGKITSFAAICLVQFSVMLLMGRYLLPYLGTPALELEGRLAASFFLACCAALAATGYGLLVGTVARSYEQASMFSAISIVVAAALGGIMVPIYAMPKIMQTLSVISPLSWGINGFLEIFVRGGGLRQVCPNAFSLLGFFAATTTISLLVSGRKGEGRG